MAEDLERSREVAALHEAAVAIASERALDKVLQKIVDVARELVAARYAALGVPGDDGKLQQFVTSGLEPAEIAAIGRRPTGNGLLGVLLHGGRPLRVAKIAGHASSCGFPPNHPSMSSFLGVPLVSHGRVLGSLCLANKIGSAEFTPKDEALIEMLAAQAAIAVENSRLFASADEALRVKVEELQAERHNLQAIVDQLPEGVAIVDAPEQKLIVANRAALNLLGVDSARKESVGASILGQVNSQGEAEPHAEALMRRVIAQGEGAFGERLTLRRADGSDFAALANASPLFDSAGKIVGGILVFQDISAQVELDRLKDELVSIISHELRNPLTAIRGRAQLMLRMARRTPGREDDVVGLLAIDAQVGKLANMVRELLDVSQMRLGLLELHRQPADLVAIAGQAIEQFRASDDQHIYELESALDGVRGEWDAVRLAQVLHNLLENAGKYSPAGGRITIRISAVDGGSPGTTDAVPPAESAASRALVAVSDEGIGIPQQAHKHLLDRFYRAANAKGRAETGLGLGLYICNEIITQHGGSMWVESTEGQGATFYFDLPLRATERV